MTRSLFPLCSYIAAIVGAGVAAGVTLPREVEAEPAAKRKQAPDRFTRAAGEAFAAAFEADQRGDLPAALGLYQKAFQISPHPSTIYNIGDVQRRMGKLTDAIKSFETYLVLSPKAADRAEVEALVAQLARTPGTVMVSTSKPSDPKSIDLSTGYILVDGEIEVRPGTQPVQTPESGILHVIELELAPGIRSFDVVTPLTYGHARCEVRPGERRFCTLTAEPRRDGNVVVASGEMSLNVFVDPRAPDRDSRMNQKLELPPGRVRLLLRDRRYECPALELEAPDGGDVAFAFVTTNEPRSFERCRTLTIKRHRLRFAGP
jgi:hypothetical protein